MLICQQFFENQDIFITL